MGDWEWSGRGHFAANRDYRLGWRLFARRWADIHKILVASRTQLFGPSRRFETVICGDMSRKSVLNLKAPC